MIVIVGNPTSKKNSSRIVGRGARKWIMPSTAYQRWAQSAIPQLRIAWAGRTPIAYPVNVTATFYRQKRVGDLNNYMSALADALEDAGVVANDRWIMGWDKTRLAWCPARPRIELEIEPLEAL